MERDEAVAGYFYPGEMAVLLKMVDGFLKAGARETRQKCIGIISPHAGYVYSGPVAGAVFAAVEIPNRVIILGPKHRSLRGPVFSVWNEGNWRTPLGVVAVDSELCAEISLKCPKAGPDVESHLEEHSLEVQIPFVQRLNPAAKIAPVAVSTHQLRDLQNFGKALAEIIRHSPEPVLIVASSDMNHHEPDEVTRRKDQQALKPLLALNEADLLSVCDRENITMCGVAPAAIMLSAAKELGATKAELVKYATSADTGGPRTQTVGYAGVMVY